MKSLEQKIIVRCKNCGWRIFDKVTMTTGVIELKCPNCHRVVEVMPPALHRMWTTFCRAIQRELCLQTASF